MHYHCEAVGEKRSHSYHAPRFQLVKYIDGWQHIPSIPALRRQRQRHFISSIGHVHRLGKTFFSSSLLRSGQQAEVNHKMGAFACRDGCGQLQICLGGAVKKKTQIILNLDVKCKAD